MTQKRFVKLIMAYGITRNHANDLAEVFRNCKKPYLHPNVWLIPAAVFAYERGTGRLLQ